MPYLLIQFGHSGFVFGKEHFWYQCIPVSPANNISLISMFNLVYKCKYQKKEQK